MPFSFSTLVPDAKSQSCLFYLEIGDKEERTLSSEGELWSVYLQENESGEGELGQV